MYQEEQDKQGTLIFAKLHKNMNKKIKETINFPKFKPKSINFTYRDENGKVVKKNVYKMNVFTDVAIISLLERMAGQSKGAITFLALGDDDTAATTSDTALVNEVYRHAVSNATVVADVLTISTFIPSTEGNDTYLEMALYGDDATAAADSGTMFTRLIINETKTYGQSLTIDYEITVPA